MKNVVIVGVLASFLLWTLPVVDHVAQTDTCTAQAFTACDALPYAAGTVFWGALSYLCVKAYDPPAYEPPPALWV